MNIEETTEQTPSIAAKDIPLFRLDADHFDEVVRLGRRLPWITPEAVHYLKVEGSFDAFALEKGQKAPEIPFEDQTTVGLPGGVVCPVCLGLDTILLQAVGPKTGLRVMVNQNCRCVFYRTYYNRWHDPIIVHSEHRNYTLETLEQFVDNRFAGWTGKPDACVDRFGKTHKWQRLTTKDLFATLREYPDYCYLFCGKAGTGKSTCLTALYEHALRKMAHRRYEFGPGYEALWKVSADVLSDQFHAWKIARFGTESRSETDIVYPPVVTVDKVTTVNTASLKTGVKPRLFLDELDKIKLDSDFQRNSYATIFSLIQENGGQIVAATNLGQMELTNRLGKQHGEAMVRRLMGEPRGIFIDFSTAEIVKSWERESPKNGEDPIGSATSSQVFRVGDVATDFPEDFLPKTLQFPFK